MTFPYSINGNEKYQNIIHYQNIFKTNHFQMDLLM